MTTATAKKILFAILCLFALIGLAAVGAFIAIKLRLTNTPGVIDTENRYLETSAKAGWQDTEEWQTLKVAVTKDAPAINKAAEASGVPPRLITAELVTEQLRLYNSEREFYKQIFQPLQILGVQSQYSLGVVGLKEETAKAIEANLKNPTSPYYLGASYEHLLDATSTDQDAERLARLTDPHDRYYSYLYAGLFLKEITVSWKKAGFDISSRPEILSTLFNIGFEHSTPNADPKVGGAEIDIGSEKYSFGGLAYSFYMSDELLSEFPR